jgi:hypothetical protein
LEDVVPLRKRGGVLVARHLWRGGGGRGGEGGEARGKGRGGVE